ncbi:MAG: hypothetical protein SFV51_08380 [Bryobacteraceae bacterium]|nr:hypothetical protein [Bryobacteraceae bacterium]
MASILIAGGFDDADGLDHPIPVFVRALAAEVIRQNHVLLGGCQTRFDAEAAKAAEAAARTAGKQAEDWIVSYVGKGTVPIHDIGSVRQSQLPRWDLLGPKLVYPEPVAQADAVILVGGWEGTRRAANWARLAGKPVLPVATFGLAAAEIFETELQDFKTRYSTRVRKNDYELLNSVVSDPAKVEAYARRVVSLAERIITPRNVFVIMSFTKDPILEDVYDTFQTACKDGKFEAFKIDEHIDTSKQRIVPEIIEAIQQAAFVIADVSEPKPNVYYELGWAQALGKDVIVTAKEGTRLPFDIYDVPTILYENQKSLREALKAKIQRIGEKYGR